MNDRRNEKGQFEKRHGKYDTRLYRIWQGMKNRCHNKKDKKDYPKYGAQGIEVCKEWRGDFTKFYRWAINAGYSDSLVIDRIDNSKGYGPSNCRWASYKNSALNRITTKFNKKDIEKIILYYEKNQVTYREVGEKFNIASSYAWQIINKKRRANE